VSLEVLVKNKKQLMSEMKGCESEQRPAEGPFSSHASNAERSLTMVMHSVAAL